MSDEILRKLNELWEAPDGCAWEWNEFAGQYEFHRGYDSVFVEESDGQWSASIYIDGPPAYESDQPSIEAMVIHARSWLEMRAWQGSRLLNLPDPQALAAENARLREAMGRIVGFSDAVPSALTTAHAFTNRMADAANAALNPPTETEATP